MINKKLLILLLKTVAKSPEVEYIHYTVSIVGHCLTDSELRGVILNENLLPEPQYEGENQLNYLALLR